MSKYALGSMKVRENCIIIYMNKTIHQSVKCRFLVEIGFLEKLLGYGAGKQLYSNRGSSC